MNGTTILVADDELYITQILAFKLQGAGASVITANDGGEAYQLTYEHRPDLIITDFQMPIMNGFEFSVKLCEKPQTAQIPVLMLTARGHKLSPNDLLLTNIKELLPKPFSAREVLAKANELLGSSPKTPSATSGGQFPRSAVA